jgi:hypothetical protein
MAGELAGQTVVVIGGSAGIGLATGASTPGRISCVSCLTGRLMPRG